MDLSKVQTREGKGAKGSKFVLAFLNEQIKIKRKSVEEKMAKYIEKHDGKSMVDAISKEEIEMSKTKEGQLEMKRVVDEYMKKKETESKKVLVEMAKKQDVDEETLESVKSIAASLSLSIKQEAEVKEIAEKIVKSVLEKRIKEEMEKAMEGMRKYFKTHDGKSLFMRAIETEHKDYEYKDQVIRCAMGLLSPNIAGRATGEQEPSAKNKYLCSSLAKSMMNIDSQKAEKPSGIGVEEN